MAETIVAHPDQSIEQLGKSVLPPNSELMHKIVQVDVGTGGKAIVVVYRPSLTTTNYSGYVLLPEARSNQLKVTNLPPMHEADGLFDFDILSIFSATLSTGKRGIAVLYKYIRLGSGEDSNNAGYFYVWDALQWSIDEHSTQRLHGVDNAKTARKKLSSP